MTIYSLGPYFPLFFFRLTQRGDEEEKAFRENLDKSNLALSARIR